MDAVKYGHGNFRDDAGQLFLIRCPACFAENYMPAVATGKCAWCGWHEKLKDEIESSKKHKDTSIQAKPRSH